MDSRFVGRAAELGELAARLDAALGGRPSVVLVGGEPGIGKTRLLAELGRLAGVRSVPVLMGRCTDEEGAPAYWPWRVVLRGWAAAAAPAERARVLGDHVADLARIAPELGRPAAGGPAASASGPEQRFALFDVTTQVLAGLAAGSGLVVVLDDLQWADAASLALLVHVARETTSARLLLAATYRTAEITADPDRAAAVAALARLPGAVRLELGGLAEPDVAAALADRLGAPPAPEVVAAVARRTGGNPFFVGELGRVLGTGGDGAVPAAVLDVVRARVARLPARCHELLGPAAVAGLEVDVDLLAAVADRPPDTLLDDLRPALDDGVLERPPGRTGLRFAHDLVREALLAGLAPGDRARIHQEMVTALEPRADDADVLPELARHALAALPVGDRGAAVHWARRAAELATGQLAHEEAARLLGRAADVARGTVGPVERSRLLVECAAAQARAHRVRAAITSCTEAAELARRAGDPEALGRAALALQEVSDFSWLHLVRGWCEEALRALPPQDGPLRAQLLAQLSQALLLEPGHRAADDLSAQALDMAERLGDRPPLLSALRARQLARSGGDGNAERIRLGSRMLAVANGDADVAMWGHLWRFDALLQAGRVTDAEAELDRLEPVVVGLRQPLARLHLLRSRVAVAFGRGRLAEASELNEEAAWIAERGGHASMQGTAVAIRFQLAVLTGADGCDPADMPDGQSLPSPVRALMHSTLARWHLALGRTSDAAAWYAGLPEPGSSRVPPFIALVLDAFRAVLATDLGDAPAAEAGYRCLLPHADLHVTGGAGATASHGSAQLYLGVAAIGSGRPDVAVGHLRAAVTANDATGLAPFAAQARARLAEALHARGRAGDADEAAALASSAAEAATRLGLAPLSARVARLTVALRGGGVLTRRETEIAGLVGRGLTNRQIAAAVHLSERTVETHVQHILAKLGFSGRSQIAAWVARRGD